MDLDTDAASSERLSAASERSALLHGWRDKLTAMLRGILAFTACSLAFAQSGPTVSAVVNTFTYTTTLCPGGLATIYGSNFGSDPTKVQVSIEGQFAWVQPTGFGATSFTIQLPFGIGTGSQSLNVTVAGVAAGPFSITLTATAPAVPTVNASGTGLGAFYDSKGNEITFTNPATPEETLTTFASGLGSTSPATPTGPSTAGNPAATLPTVTVGGVNCTVLGAVLYPSTTVAGVYQVNFIVPASGVQGTAPVVISTGGLSSPNTVTLPIAGTSSVVNNASFANPGTIAPGSIASIFANGLGSAITLETSGVFPSTTSEGLQITFNGIPAPIFHVIPPTAPGFSSSGQIDLLVPDTLPTTGTVNVQLTTSTADYANYTLNMAAASPGLYRFTDPKTSNQYAIVQFANSAWVDLPVTATSDIGLPACAASTPATTQCGQPANIGDYLVIYLTGLGLATVNGNPTGATLPVGQNPPANGSTLYETPTMPTVTIGGVAATPLFSGLAPGFAGEYQIDVQVPAGVASGDSVPLVVTMMGQKDTANISIQPSRVPPPNQ